MTDAENASDTMITINEVCQFLDQKGVDYRFLGNKEDTFDHIANISEPTEHSICWIKSKEYLTDAIRQKLRSLGSVLVISCFPLESANTIVVPYPKNVIFLILNHFFPKKMERGISDRAVVLTKKLGENLSIGPGCYIEEDVKIGDNTIIHPNVVIECPCTIGHDCEIFAGVVIGTDGFGYYKDNNGIERREMHYGGVVIGNYVEIGANACIDRGLLSNTVIRDHTKIDNLTYIAHNVVIEENCLIIGGSVICGSAKIGRDAYLAPNSTVLNQVTVGNRSKIGVGSVAMRNVKDDVTVFGNPGKILPQPPM